MFRYKSILLLKQLAIIVIFHIIAFFLYSCDSPTDVQANRIKIENKKSGASIFKLEPNNIIFERIIMNREYEVKILMTNLTEKDLIISKMFFKHQPQNFRLKNNQQITLKPIGTSNNYYEFSIIVQAKQLGFIYDTLFLDSYYEPIVVVAAHVPTVYTSNLDFGKVSVREVKYKTIDIYNFGDKSVIIKDYTISGDIDFFKIENFNPKISPIIIEPNGNIKQFIVSFAPHKDIEYNAIITFEIETNNSGIIHNVSELKGLAR